MNARGLFASTARLSMAAVSMAAVTAGCTAAGGDADGQGGALRIERIEAAVDGTPYFASGQLGRIDPQVAAQLADPDGAMAAIAGVLPAIAGTLRVPAEDLIATGVEHDALGMTHVRMAQRKDGLRVVGGDVVLHVGADGTVRSVTSTARDRALDARPAIDAAAARGVALAAAAQAAQTDAVIAGPVEAKGSELTYVISTGDHELYLAWEIEVTAPGGELVLDKVYVDARTGQVVDRRPQVFTARYRVVYNGEGKTLQMITTPPVMGNEITPPTGDPIAVAAFDNTGATYDCYKVLYQRDSYNGLDSDIASIVHVLFQGPGGTTGNNAAWISQPANTGIMVYGDGDGNVMGPTAYGFDVTAHELTHGVTSTTANLAYMNESGALNEGMSDIMAAVCEAWKDKAISADTWKVGEDIWTPNTAGDALRYMDNPMTDGSSRDFYADRYQGTQDNGGVHTNSGIANLAFYLLATGGKHPKGKTSNQVPPLGIEWAGAIFERALTKGYFTSTTDFAQARAATEQAAQDLYQGCVKVAVSAAWAAVGVGTAPPADAVAPTTAITSPADGATVPTGFSVEVDAADDQCVLRVELAIDGTPVASTATAPYTLATDPGLAPGMHTITVTTYDATNKSTDTRTVMVATACEKSDQCADGESCDSGVCQSGGGGCCSTGGRGVAGSIGLAFAVAFALRRRRR